MYDIVLEPSRRPNFWQRMLPDLPDGDIEEAKSLLKKQLSEVRRAAGSIAAEPLSENWHYDAERRNQQ